MDRAKLMNCSLQLVCRKGQAPRFLRRAPASLRNGAALIATIMLASCGSKANMSTTTVPQGKSASSQYAQLIASVASPNSTTLWVRLTSGDVFYSSDSGSTWVRSTPSQWNSAPALATRPSPGPTPFSVTANSAHMAHELRQGVISVANSSDQGNTWQVADLPKSYPQGTGPVGVSFPNASDGWASVNLLSGSAFAHTDLFETTNAGSTWSLETQINGAAGPVEFITPTAGFAGNTPGMNQLLMTIDGGKSWNQVALPIPAGMQAQQILAPGLPIFTDHEHGFMYVAFEKKVGHGPLVPYMDETQDGGLTWTQVALPSASNQPIVWSVVSPTNWFLVSSDSVMHTTDGGNTWSTVTPNKTLTNVQTVAFSSDNIGVAVIDTSTCPKPSSLDHVHCIPNNGLIRTTDGGKTWHSLAFP